MAPTGIFIDAEAPTDLEFTDRERARFVRSPGFRRWFAGSCVTHDGSPTGRPIMVFRGCTVGSAPRPEAILWLTSSRLNASFFEDGELQNAYVRLARPLVITEAEFRQGRTTPDRIAEDARRQAGMGLANWDGVIFEDIVDGSHPATNYAIFPGSAAFAQPVLVVGRTVYDADGMPRFTGLQPSAAPVSFNRFDEIGRNAIRRPLLRMPPPAGASGRRLTARGSS
jgi:hypothetical protein